MHLLLVSINSEPTIMSKFTGIGQRRYIIISLIMFWWLVAIEKKKGKQINSTFSILPDYELLLYALM